MNGLALIRRSLIFYRRTHIGIVLGTALSSTILVGSLLLGNSVRVTLRNMIHLRLQNVEAACHTNDRFFAAELADRLAEGSSVPVMSSLHLKGSVIGDDSRVNEANVYGIRSDFGSLIGRDLKLSADEAAINQRLADRLGIKTGDEVLLRVEKLSLLPGDAPLSVNADNGVAFRVTIKEILPTNALGNLSLRNESVLPLNIFVNHKQLAQELELAGKANLLLAGTGATAEALNQSLSKAIRISDVGLSMAKDDATILVSDQIFIPPAAETKLLSAGDGLVTYLVNSLRVGKRTTPYSFVNAGSSNAPELADDEIAVSDWLAKDLNAKVGDQIELKYFIPEEGESGLKEVAADFTIKQILPMDNVKTDQALMPQYPGMADGETCQDWDSELPIDLKRIRPQDEEYWAKYRGTPKAYVSMETAQRLWSSRFGLYTGVRVRNATTQGELNRLLVPAAFGLQFQDVKADALAGKHSVDFGGLFIGLGFFVIVAALVLTSLLFAFNVEQRQSELGLMMSLGFTKGQISRLVLIEGSVLAGIGAVLGIPFGIGFNHFVLRQLSTVWSGAVNAMILENVFDPASIVIGVCSSLLVAVASMYLAVRRQVKHAAARLQAGPRTAGRWGKVYLMVGVVFALAAVAMVLGGDPGKGKDAAAIFMGSGAMMMLGGIFVLSWLFRRKGPQTHSNSLLRLATRGNTRRPGRSLTVLGLLASGVFLVVGVAANRHDPLRAAGTKTSGTGGFHLFGETALPVFADLQTKKGQRKYRLGDERFSGVKIASLRLRQGGDASCLNLNRVYSPQILGANPKDFAGRFGFASTPKEGWEALNEDLGEDVIPAIADINVIMWSLGKSVGKDMDYVNEAGQPIKLRFVGGLKNSILQGSVVISNRHFTRHFPSSAGAKVFLIDVPVDKRNGVQTALNDAFADVGMELTPCNARLSEYNRVESTYLEIFLAFGALGLLIGSAGLAIVILRNVLERKSELAILRACGFSLGQVRKLVFLEHLQLLLFGLAIGIVSSALAILPALQSASGEIPWGQLIGFLASLFVLGLLWTYLASVVAVKGKLLDALRNE